MVIGCLAEVFNNVPEAIPEYFDTYMELLMKNSTSDNGSLNRNVSYALGVFARKAPKELFQQHTGTVLKMASTMF